jgi:glycosyltransferase involved in cell wall biosynthesis
LQFFFHFFSFIIFMVFYPPCFGLIFIPLCVTKLYKKIIMLHIGFDAKRVFQNTTGLGNYSRGLISGLQTQFPKQQYTLFAPKIVLNATTAPFAAAPYRVVSPTGNRNYWRTVGILSDIRRTNIDIYHGLSHELPIGIAHKNVATVVTIHDLIFRRYPQQYSWWDRHAHDLKCEHACRVADKIIAISESTKRDIIEYYGVAAQKIEVVYQSCHPRFYTDMAAETPILSQKKISTPYILYVGSIIARKNLLNLAKAVALLPPALADLKLYVVGGGAAAYRNEVVAFVQKNNLQHRIIFLQNVTDDELPALYKNAAALVYPSQYEGFGIPIIEALFSQTPVITGTQLALTEAAGAGSCCIDVQKPAVIAEAITQVVSDVAFANATRSAGILYAQRFLPQGLAQQLMQVYKGL